MKSLLLALCLFMTACASTQTAQVAPIRVTGTGSTQEQALKNAFREAVQIKVGSAVLGARESVNSKLTKDEVANYSAGYVDEYKIVDTNTVSGMTKVTVDVWVRNSEMAMHKINTGKDEKSFDGDRLDAQYSTIQTQQRDATMVYQKIVNDLPTKGFDLKYGKINRVLNDQNQLVLEIPYMIAWNQRYLKSLNESLGLVGDTKNMTQQKIEVKADEGRWYDVIRSYYFKNFEHKEMFAKQLREWYIKLSLVDEMNKTIVTQCFRPFRAPEKLWKSYGGDNLGYHDLHVLGTNQIYDKHYINISELPVKRIHSVKMETVSIQNCAYGTVL